VDTYLTDLIFGESLDGSVKVPMPRRDSARPTARPDRPVVVTTFRIFADQRDALQRSALDRRGSGAGRLDASAVLRELLDEAGMRDSENE
jgi:hypothetical protein